MMGPAEEDAERAGGSDTSLPGRRALQPPFPEGTAVHRPGLCRGARAPGLLGPRTHSRELRVAGMQVRIELSNRGL